LWDSVTNTDRQRYCHTDSNRYGDSYRHRHCHVHANSCGYSHLYSNSYSYCYIHAHGNGNSNSHSHSYRNCNSDGDSHSSAARCSDGLQCNQCDYEQLHRKLEQRCRGDRLSVGCGYEQFVYQFRNPKPGCRACH